MYKNFGKKFEMINTREKLNDCLKIERKLYQEIGYKGKLHAWISACEIGKIYAYIEALRKDEYYTNKNSKNFIDSLKKAYFHRRHNRLGVQLGMSIPINTFGKGLVVYHSQGIIVHKDSRNGEFCKLHGLNCIGNNGADGGVPKLRDYVDIGVGAVIIGDVIIASHTKVAANSVVCKSFTNDNQVLAGVPARVIKIEKIQGDGNDESTTCKCSHANV